MTYHYKNRSNNFQKRHIWSNEIPPRWFDKNAFLYSLNVKSFFFPTMSQIIIKSSIHYHLKVCCYFRLCENIMTIMKCFLFIAVQFMYCYNTQYCNKSCQHSILYFLFDKLFDVCLTICNLCTIWYVVGQFVSNRQINFKLTIIYLYPRLYTFYTQFKEN